MSYRGPKVKLSRKLGIALTNRAAIVMSRRSNPPGQHGARRRRSNSDYGQQLFEKQRLRFQYNVSERQMRKYFAKAKKEKGNTADELLQVLESRLDNAIYRAGFAPTIYAARQLVSHGHCLVNGRRVNIASFMVKATDEIGIRKKSQDLPIVRASIEASQGVPYLEVDRNKFTAKFIAVPKREEIPVICEVQQVVEYYSR